MAIRLARSHSAIERALLWGGACLLVYTSTLAQASRQCSDGSSSTFFRLDPSSAPDSTSICQSSVRILFAVLGTDATQPLVSTIPM